MRQNAHIRWMVRILVLLLVAGLALLVFNF
jgi:hypothetical protein